jgi:hypothetical protein
VLPRKAIASRVVHPNIKTEICKEERHRVESVATDASCGIEQPVLVQDDRLLCVKLLVVFRVSASGSRNAEDTIDVVVFGIVVVTLNWIIVIADHLHESLVLVLLVGQR